VRSRPRYPPESCFRYRRHRGADHTSPISLHAGEVMRISLLEALASAGWTGGGPPYEGRQPSGR
jgi:hypothetical protein